MHLLLHTRYCFLFKYASRAFTVKRIWLLSGIVLYGLMVNAQSDTLSIAKQLRNKGDIKGALRLLKAFHSNHPADLNTTWLNAQTLYWDKNFKASVQLYDDAIQSNPKNYYLKLDYAKVLVALGKFEKAIPLLKIYNAYYPGNAEVNAAFADIYWQGNQKTKVEVKEFFTPSSADTLNHARQLKSGGKIKEAARLLKAYQANHLNELNANWLYAQVLYWGKHLKASEKLYEKAIRDNPSNYYLKLDFAKTLVDAGKFEKAKPMLDQYLAYDPMNAQALIAKVKILYGLGEYKKADGMIRDVLQKDGNNKDACSLQDEIHLAESPWLKIYAGYNIDDQPLQSIAPGLEAGVYLHPFSTLLISAQTPVFLTGGKIYNVQWLQAGDQIAFRKIGLEFDVNAGILKQPYNNMLTWTGNASVNQTLAKHLVLHACVERKPYYYTISSLNVNLMENRYAAFLGWDNMNSMNGKALFEVNQFPDKNYVTSFAAWVFAPPIKVSVFEFRLGYSYSFGTSKENRFTPLQSLSQIIANYTPTEQITGVYDPYFTPDNQQVHSGLVAIAIHPVKILDIGLHAALGFYGTTQTPYFYLDKNISNETYIAAGYAKEIYFPMQAGAYANISVTKKISLKAEYAFNKSYFYTSHYVSLGLRLSFWKG